MGLIRPHRILFAIVAMLALGFLCGCAGSQPPPGTDPPVVVDADTPTTPAGVAARIRSIAVAVQRAYPDKPEVSAIAGAIGEAAGFVELGNYQGAGQVIVSIASRWPAFREYAVLASIALELLSPGPTQTAVVQGKAMLKADAVKTWSQCVRGAAPGP